MTVALAGSSCWVADALARALAGTGDHVLRLDPDDERAAGQHGTGCGADVVVHLAGGPLEASLHGRSEPALETLAALHAARVDGARLVIVSLPGNSSRTAADEALAAGFRSAHDVETVVVEVVECYGPGMPAGRTGVLGRMLHQARTTGVVVVEVDDDRTHPVCFVEDAVAGLVAVVRDGTAGTRVEVPGRIRVAPAAGMPTLGLARAVADATGATLRVRDRRRLQVAAPVPPAAPVSPGAPAPSTAPAGWEPQVGLAEGLARFLAGRPDAVPGGAPTAAGAVRAGATSGAPGVAADDPTVGAGATVRADRSSVVDLREPAVPMGTDVVA